MIAGSCPFRKSRGFVIQIGSFENGEKLLKQIAADQTDEDRDRGGAQIVNKRLDTDGADFFDITHRNDTGQDREQNDRDDYELEQIQENSSDGFDVAFGKLHVAL